MLGKESAQYKRPHKFLDPLRCVNRLINAQAAMDGVAQEHINEMIGYANEVSYSVWKMKNALIFLPYNTGYDFETLIINCIL